MQPKLILNEKLSMHEEFDPISGLIHCIISPCNIAIDLDTPCVAGCCGPELIIIDIK